MFDISWLNFALLALFITQTIIILVTVYFHRACSHMAISLNPKTNSFFRFLAWFLISMDPKEFAAIHRKHHAKCDTEEDPHSPVNHGPYGVLFKGLFLYQKEAKNSQTIEKYGKGLKVDSLEPFYQKYPNLGIFLFGLILISLIGLKGLLLWILVLMWIPFWAAGVVNGLGHHYGYRNYQTDDLSTNLIPFGIWIGGEELHNNHHAYPTSAKFSRKWFEFDIGYGFIKILEFFNLAVIRDSQTQSNPSNPLTIFIKEKHKILLQFQNSVNQYLKDDLKLYGFKKWQKVSRLLDKKDRLNQSKKTLLNKALNNPNFQQILLLEIELRQMWQLRKLTLEHIVSWQKKASLLGCEKINAFCSELLPIHLKSP